MRITAMAPVPGAVAMAAMVSAHPESLLIMQQRYKLPPVAAVALFQLFKVNNSPIKQP
jgi:hypothetical protein